MRASAIAGIVFANINDALMKKLTSKRSMASVPFGARYRLIDFSLSNLVNAGISNVGIITKENYRSLMDHVGSGVYWDLDRKNGGLHLLPPYVSSGAKRNIGTVDALNGAMDYIRRCNADYMVLSNADTVANIDISAAIESHLERGADVTIGYHYGLPPKENEDTAIPVIDKDGRIKSITFGTDGESEINFCIGLTVISRELLIKLINEGYAEGASNFTRDVLNEKLNSLKVYGYCHSEFVAVMDSAAAYYKASMRLLDADVRRQLFNKARPIYTKTRDDMPTRYGTKSSVNNTIIADGCVINGTVNNSIISRGVTVEKGAVVENCIIMQETVIKEGACLNNVIADKNAVISADTVLKGKKGSCFFVEKNQTL